MSNVHELPGQVAGHRPAGQHRAAPRRTTWSLGASILRRVAKLTVNLAVIACLIAFLGLAVGPHVFGYRTITMLTGSMAPMIDPGDVVISVPHPAASLEVGDVITYHIPVEDHRIETHRVTEVSEKSDGSMAVKTKGDANNGVDPWTAVMHDEVVWKTEFVVPHLGKAIRALRNPLIQDAVFWGAMAALILLGLSMIWGSSQAKDEETERDVAAPRPQHLAEVIALDEHRQDLDVPLAVRVSA